MSHRDIGKNQLKGYTTSKPFQSHVYQYNSNFQNIKEDEMETEKQRGGGWTKKRDLIY